MTDSTRRGLLTSVYLKTHADDRVPEDEECYYLLSRSGLFIGRNRQHMHSLVRSRNWPGELQHQEPFLKLGYPKVPADLLERIVGFFWTVACRHGAEAAVLLAFDEESGLITPVVPQQIGTIGWTTRREPYPIGLHYEVPPQVGGRRLIGDFHSHAFEPAYASGTDVQDEVHRPGLHVVAGRLDRDPPQWHVEYVVDGTRFRIAPESALDLDGYSGRTVPADPKWLGCLDVQNASDYARQHAPTKYRNP